MCQWKFAMLFTGLLACSAAQAQPNGEAKRSSPPRLEFAERFDQAFLKRPPLVGDKAPQLHCLGADGKPFDWDATHGAYRVLVFGCLT